MTLHVFVPRGLLVGDEAVVAMERGVVVGDETVAIGRTAFVGDETFPPALC